MKLITKILFKSLSIGLFLATGFSTQGYAQEFEKEKIKDSLAFRPHSDSVYSKAYERLSVKMYCSLDSLQKDSIQTIRNLIIFPDSNTIFQKVITLADMRKYYAPDSSGNVGGFIAMAADVKKLTTTKEMYWGLRLDFPSTPFDTNSGYAVIRFTLHKDSITNYLRIPCCCATSKPSRWVVHNADPPYSGTGFTTSSFGKGGYPEYKLLKRCYPEKGEVYKVDKDGTETLFSTFNVGVKKWEFPPKTN